MPSFGAMVASAWSRVDFSLSTRPLSLLGAGLIHDEPTFAQVAERAILA